MKDKSFVRIEKQLGSIYTIKPNNLLIPLLTSVYKLATEPLKSFPFKIFVPLSLLAFIIFFVIFGFLITRLVSLLQYGF